jgi:hypothetical protein
MDYRYKLEKYAGPKMKHACPACGHKGVFTRYVDLETMQYLDECVGRCDRESNCGYHYKPGEYFKKEKPAERHYVIHRSESVKTEKPEPIRQHYIDAGVLAESLRGYEQNNFVQFLAEKFGKIKTEMAVEKYLIGTDTMFKKFGTGSVIFWQVDNRGNVRSGKIMQYNPKTGKRIKGENGYRKISWVHYELRRKGVLSQEEYELKQCLFGLHLIRNGGKDAVAIVESEKTAIIASLYLPEMIWMSCGALNNIKEEMLLPLKGRKIILFPDLSGYEKWVEKAGALQGYDITVSAYLEMNATDQEKEQGLDIADYLLKYEVRETKIQKEENKLIPCPRIIGASSSPSSTGSETDGRREYEKENATFDKTNYLDGIVFGENWFEIWHGGNEYATYIKHSTLENLREYFHRLHVVFGLAIPDEIRPYSLPHRTAIS